LLVTGTEAAARFAFSLVASSKMPILDMVTMIIERGSQMRVLLAFLLFTVSATAQMTTAALLKMDRDFQRATSEKRLDGWMSYMMDSTVIFGPPTSAQRIVGKEEIQDYYRTFFAMPNFRMSWTPKKAVILPSGETGYTSGTFHWILPNPGCHCVNDWKGTYLAVWELDSHISGEWKLKALFPSIEGGSGCGCAS
jgi:ketosteroid isomerase-like protein